MGSILQTLKRPSRGVDDLKGTPLLVAVPEVARKEARDTGGRSWTDGFVWCKYRKIKVQTEG
jgi:hypothetical protein